MGSRNGEWTANVGLAGGGCAAALSVSLPGAPLLDWENCGRTPRRLAVWGVVLLGCRASVMGVGLRALVQWPSPQLLVKPGVCEQSFVACLVPPTHAEEAPGRGPRRFSA